jgi:hypothetical protein
MTCIIQDKDHFFNLDHIATIREVRPGLFQALDENGDIMDEFPDFYNAVLKILPLGKDEWECLFPVPEEESGYVALPVIAWALNPERRLLPFLPNGCEPVHCEQDFGMRQIGSEIVYASHGDTFENVSEWLAAVSR